MCVDQDMMAFYDHTYLLVRIRKPWNIFCLDCSCARIKSAYRAAFKAMYLAWNIGDARTSDRCQVSVCDDCRVVERSGLEPDSIPTGTIRHRR